MARVTAKQADKVISQANSAATTTKTKVENAIREFSETVSHIWEDKNATTYAGKLKESINSCIKELSDNNGIFGSAVTGIFEGYRGAGGNDDKMQESAISFSGNVDISKIKDHFANDSFGFGENDEGEVDVAGSKEKIMAAFKKLKEELTKARDTSVSEIESINAFGNAEIRSRLARSSGEVVRILEDHINEIDKLTADYVEETAKGYKSVEEKAKEAADLRATE